MARRTPTKRVGSGIGTATLGLGMLLQSLVPGGALAIDCQGDQFYNRRTGEYETCRPRPDFRGCKFVGHHGPIKKVDVRAEPETTLAGYRCGSTEITLYVLPNGKIYGFASYDTVLKEMNHFWDYENDGNFEQTGRKCNIDKKSYGY